MQDTTSLTRPCILFSYPLPQTFILLHGHNASKFAGSNLDDGYSS